MSLRPTEKQAKALAKKEDQLTYKSDNPKKEKFVELYGKLYGHITNTCAGIGISRDTYYRWLDEDKEFAMAIAQSEMTLNDEIRDVLINKAASGDMTAVIFYLKNRHPDFRYKDQPTTAIQINFNEHVKKELEEFE